MAFACPPLPVLKETLINSEESIGKRTHAAFYLRSFFKEEAVEIISEALRDRKGSSLLRHELAYILGQIGNKEACSILSSILQDEDDDVLVRHESAEALGAIGDPNSLTLLENYSSHKYPEISETCLISIDLIQWRASGEAKPPSSYVSVDPAPPHPKNIFTVGQLENILMDTTKTLFQRYRAMFTLRDMNTDESALALVSGFKDESSLFRHEIAYVLGQMERAVTIEGLAAVLKDLHEHRMVRHEAAEALGAIGGSKVEELLENYRNDKDDVVKESCVVALDTIEFWS